MWQSHPCGSRAAINVANGTPDGNENVAAAGPRFLVLGGGRGLLGVSVLRWSASAGGLRWLGPRGLPRVFSLGSAPPPVAAPAPSPWADACDRAEHRDHADHRHEALESHAVPAGITYGGRVAPGDRCPGGS